MAEKRPFPYVSLCGALGFAGSMLVLAIFEWLQAPDPSPAAQRSRILRVMVCVLIATWSTIISLVTAWCPIILGGDRRPWYWTVPLLLGWFLFLQLFDWTSLLP